MAKVNQYEIACVIDADLTPEELDGIKTKFIDLAKAQGAELGEMVQWDRRHMAYDIRGKSDAFYFFMNLKATSVAVDEISRNMRLSDKVLRHMVIRPDIK